MTVASIEVTPGVAEPLHGGLIRVATVVPNARGLGTWYFPEACGPALVDDERCNDPDPAPADKEFEGVPYLEGEPFAIYKGLECDLFETTGPLSDQAARGLELGQSRAIEQGVWERLLATAASTDINAAGAVTPKRALGLLEEYAATYYGLAPTLHISRAVVPYLPDVQVKDNHLETVQGSLIANGAGYTANTSPAGVAGGADIYWVYMTGRVVLSLSDVKSYTAPMQTLNRQRVLAERVVTPTVECFSAAIRVTLAGA